MVTRFAWKRTFNTVGTATNLEDDVWLAQSFISSGYAAYNVQAYLYFQYFVDSSTEPPITIPSLPCKLRIRAADESNLLPVGNDLVTKSFDLGDAIRYAQYQGPPYYPAVYRIIVNITGMVFQMDTNYTICISPDSVPGFNWIYNSVNFSDDKWTIPPDPEKDEGRLGIRVSSRSTDGGVTWAAVAQDNYGMNMELYGDLVEAVVYPIDMITRITNITHRYIRASQVYTMESNLGEVVSDFGLPRWLSKPQTTVSSKVRKPVEVKNIPVKLSKDDKVTEPPKIVKPELPKIEYPIWPVSDKVTMEKPMKVWTVEELKKILGKNK